MNRPPSREELESQVSEAHRKLAELRKAQDALERERIALEESKRRRAEFQTGREEMLRHLTRGIVSLESRELSTRQDAEKMNQSLLHLREALGHVQSIQEEKWTSENYTQELTRALTLIENARMEWNSAQIKWSFLADNSNLALLGSPPPEVPSHPFPNPFSPGSAPGFWHLTRLGLAFTWPLILVGVGFIIVLVLILVRR